MDTLDVNALNASLQESLDVSRAHNSQLVLLVLASKDQTDKDLHPFQKAMLDFAQANHVPVINMVDYLAQHPTANFYMDPVHPTVAGHQVIAGQLYTLIQGLPVYEQACAPPASVVSVRTAPKSSEAR